MDGYKHGGGFCEPPDPTSRYAYTISSDRQTLRFKALGQDPCKQRRDLLTAAGLWRLQQ